MNSDRPSDPTPNGPEDVGWTPEAKQRPPRRFPIPLNTLSSTCKSCHAMIFWIELPSGSHMPVNPDETSHFATCPNAAKHRKPR